MEPGDMDYSSHDMAHMNHGAHHHEMGINDSHNPNMDDIMNVMFNSSKDIKVIQGIDLLKSHGNHHEENKHKGHTMSMTFHGGFVETILFSWWNVTEVGEFIGSFFAIFALAVLYEGLKYYRKHLLWKTYTGLQYCAVAPPDKGVANICAPDEPQVIQTLPHTLERNVPTMMSVAHGWQTVLHGVQVLVSYMLMLVFMTYNTWLCAAVVLGSATGYFLFGWRESVVVDFTEHCH
ncbi:high affinity copper uptake protein 1-like isoform X1 [Maniola jurtina]|uniref:high affinity copper uptake protein 1-like isoform X1 n=1 Tax=Maniola jurtina TaxID=191418 RepID=UPI001E687D22|nr:high affinity copper uptake protein 1-like isoform X1 [Maniola jurtina]XP_045761132.1 high affinity copper uptake protein 1-like isoform X1 [Maniola jurtina]XP_045761133.1 high affinity copper uptake protein 1-like isoform X1 [Maniola jurtina]XP_045761134.1 high affinity copper uptake protein 1-like isoform X1 [Maniola jurtina]